MRCAHSAPGPAAGQGALRRRGAVGGARQAAGPGERRAGGGGGPRAAAHRSDRGAHRVLARAPRGDDAPRDRHGPVQGRGGRAARELAAQPAHGAGRGAGARGCGGGPGRARAALRPRQACQRALQRRRRRRRGQAGACRGPPGACVRVTRHPAPPHRRTAALQRDRGQRGDGVRRHRAPRAHQGGPRDARAALAHPQRARGVPRGPQRAPAHVLPDLRPGAQGGGGAGLRPRPALPLARGRLQGRGCGAAWQGGVPA